MNRKLNEHSYLRLKSTTDRSYYFDFSIRRYLVDEKSSFHPWREDHARELAVMVEKIILKHEFHRALPVDKETETAA